MTVKTLVKEVDTLVIKSVVYGNLVISVCCQYDIDYFPGYITCQCSSA